jgi:lipoyl(octanoyl) transferase
MATPSTSTSRSAEAGLLRVLDWGRTEYGDGLARQHDLVARRLAGDVQDLLVLTEHEPVITLGRGTKPENVRAPSFPIVMVERGGDATWHGPGQVVGYPIRLLPAGARDLVAHLRWIEDLLIATLAEFGIAGRRVTGRTGVWVGATPRKIASIGVAARRWCTYHGFALNVDCELSAFEAINPCGFAPSVMTSIADVLGASPGLERAKAAVSAALGRCAPPAPDNAPRSPGA